MFVSRNINDLPNEIIAKMMQELPMKDVVSLMRSSKRFYLIATNHIDWSKIARECIYRPWSVKKEGYDYMDFIIDSSRSEFIKKRRKFLVQERSSFIFHPLLVCDEVICKILTKILPED